MTETTKQKGDAYEEMAVSYLIKSGYSIVKRNFRYGNVGEVDIVAKKKDTLVFVEVRSKSKKDTVSPEETVKQNKLSKIKKVAEFYLYVNRLTDQLCRVDVITFVSVNGLPEINHYKNVTI